MKLGVACDGWEIKSSDDIEEVAKLQCEPVEHEGCSVCDPLEINTGIPCYKTVFVDELPEAGISGILYVTKTDDEYSIYEWDGSVFVNVTSPVSCALQTKTVTPAASQVQYLPDSGYDGFDKVTVEAIPSEYIVPTGTKNISANGNDQDVRAYEKVNVNVPNSYSASDEGKVVQSGALVSQSSQMVTENGTYDTTLKNEVVVDVQGGGGGGGTVIASGTIAGNGGYGISVPVGTKMPETDFAFVIHLPKNQEITYVDDSNNQILLWIEYVVLKKTQRFDLSSVANNIKSTNTLGLTVNNDGTIKNLNPNGTAAIRVSSRANGYVFAMAGNESSQTISRTATGFKVTVSSAAWMMVFRTGYTYEWEIIYFGDDPTNDIVEIS